MSGRDTHAFTDLLPLRIDRAEIEDPTLLIGGDGWSMSATCDWAWIRRGGPSLRLDSAGAVDLIWDLVGDEVVSVEWSTTRGNMLDPLLRLRSGGLLQVESDADFDTWVIHTPSLVLVGPLLLE